MDIKVYKRPDSPFWQCKIKLPGISLSRRSTAVPVKSSKAQAKKAAQAIAKKLWERYSNGAAKTVTFTHAATSYVAQGKDARFIAQLVSHFGNTLVADITPQDVRNAAIKLYPNRRPETLNRNAITPCRSILNHAEQQEWRGSIRINAFTESDLMRLGWTFAEKRETIAIGMEWIEAFIAEANPYLAALELFMFQTAARISSAISMESDDFNLQQGVALIPPDKEHPARLVYLTPRMVAMLANLKPRNGRVFGYKNRWGVYGTWKRACKRAGIEYIPPHQAGRHSFATELIIRQKVDIKTVADLGGWKSTKILLNTYTHPEGHKDIILNTFGTKSTQAINAKRLNR